MSHSTELSADALLEHEPFVRAVVRGLVSDEAQVHDVVQETWLRALRRPPRGGAPLRVWLARVASNLARDARRSSGRRTYRERAVARPERVESVDEAYERLSAQREVVDVVLGLDEPYRGVVILTYYKGLSAAEVGEQLGRSPATVRSQLSRAREILRGALDMRFGGRRTAWVAPLFPLAQGEPVSTPAAAMGSSTAWKAGLGLAAAAACSVVLVSALRGQRASSAQSLAGVAAPAARTVPSLPAPGLRPLDESRVGPARSPVTQDERADDHGPDMSLAGRPIPELFDLAVQTQRAIESRLLTVDQDVLAAHAEFLSQPGTGISRIRTGDGPEGAQENVTTRRGEGTYFSFATLDHSYDAEPDLSFRGGRFGAGFYGGQVGLLMKLNGVALRDVPALASSAPASLPEARLDHWRLMWREASAGGKDLRRDAGDLGRSIRPEGTDSTFLLRVVSPDEHDHLVAFQPLVLDGAGCTFLWRILETWPMSGRGQERPARFGENLDVPDGPAWLADLSLEGALDLLTRIRAEVGGPLLDIPDELKGRYAKVVGESAASFADKTGFARILERGRLDPLMDVRGGGAYYSFLRRSNSYGEASELELQQRRYSSGFAGYDTGLLLDLGEIPIDQLGSVMSGHVPGGLDRRGLQAWDFMWTVRAEVPDGADGGRRQLNDEDEARIEELGLGRGVNAIVGHTYLLRSVLFDTHDHLVVFTVIDGDEYGHTLAWRILKTWPVQ